MSKEVSGTTQANVLGAVTAGDRRGADAEPMRRALQINSAWLKLLADKFELERTTTRATIRHEGRFLAECSLSEALDMANEALEPTT